MKFMIVGLLLVTAQLVKGNNPDVIPGYSYDESSDKGPSKWGTLSAACSPDQADQSPIDLSNAELEYIRPFEFYKDSETLPGIAVHLVEAFVLFIPPMVEIYGGGIDGNLTVRAIIVYWGENDTDGSEHAINGQRAAAELAIIAEGQGGRYQFIVLFEEGDENSAFTTLLKPSLLNNISVIALDESAAESNEIEFPNFKSFLPQDIRNFYQYNGTFTRPDCQEGWTYIVFKEKATMSSSQLSALRTFGFETAAGFVPGSIRRRPLQPTNDRKITGTLGLNFFLGIIQWKKDLLHNIFGGIFG